jgi:hypothetical protein
MPSNRIDTNDALAAGCNASLVNPIDFERLESFMIPICGQS